MPFSVSAVGGVTAAIAALGLVYLRRKISRKWITSSSVPAVRFSTEQTAVVTGGNAGLGYEVAKDLAGRGGRVILACRDCDAGRRAAREIRGITGNDAVECARLDLSSLDSVRAFASELTSRDERIRALICNAGVWMPERGRKTGDGFEIHFGVNHLGHFALIQLLLPLMEKSGEDSRVIIVSSSLAKMGKIDLKKRDFIHDGRLPAADGKKSFAPAGYCDSKLMNMLTSRELAARLAARGSSSVTTYAVCPGFCKSGLGRNVRMPFYQAIFLKPVMSLFQRSSVQGAQNIIFVATEHKANLESGAMYQDGKIWEDGLQLSSLSEENLQNGLWELSEELIENKLKETVKL